MLFDVVNAPTSSPSHLHPLITLNTPSLNPVQFKASAQWFSVSGSDSGLLFIEKQNPLQNQKRSSDHEVLLDAKKTSKLQNPTIRYGDCSIGGPVFSRIVSPGFLARISWILSWSRQKTSKPNTKLENIQDLGHQKKFKCRKSRLADSLYDYNARRPLPSYLPPSPTSHIRPSLPFFINIRIPLLFISSDFPIPLRLPPFPPSFYPCHFPPPYYPYPHPSIQSVVPAPHNVVFLPPLLFPMQ